MWIVLALKKVSSFDAALFFLVPLLAFVRIVGFNNRERTTLLYTFRSLSHTQYVDRVYSSLNGIMHHIGHRLLLNQESTNIHVQSVLGDIGLLEKYDR